MLRAVASAAALVEAHSGLRRDAFKVFRVCKYTSAASKDQHQTRKLKKYRTTVLSHDGAKVSDAEHTSPIIASSSAGDGGGSREAPPPPPAPSPSPRTWSALAALAVTASLGGVYLYRRRHSSGGDHITNKLAEERDVIEESEPPSPASAASLPGHVQYLLVGGGTASFAAMRAIRSARPDAQVLIVSAERALPYMRPPLSKELWREPDLAAHVHAADIDSLTFRQWNGRRRSLVYEPNAFYTPPEQLHEGRAGAGVARGWRVTRIDPARHTAYVTDAAQQQTHELTYDKCLLATGVRPRRLAALRPAAASGRALALRGVRDMARLAAALDDPATRTVAIVGGSFLAAELAAALADRLKASDKRVLLVCSEEAPLARVLPLYLAQDAARRLAAAGVSLLPRTEVTASAVEEPGARVVLSLSSGERLEADLVVECAGSEPNVELAERSAIETHPDLGGVVVNAEMQARTDVYAAGDVACFHDVVLGRRRVEHHDHAVVSGRLAGENMAALAPPKHYSHQSMFWSDLGPQLGYEAIGIIDSRLPTVGVFSADAVGDEAPAPVQELAVHSEGDAVAPLASGTSGTSATLKSYERGVLFYLRDQRVVGVLLWNLFNRMHVARQVLAQGEFEDLFEVAKLFSPHEEE